MTDDERKVIDILTGFGETTDCWDDPIHAVDQALNWETPKTRQVVKHLVNKGLAARGETGCFYVATEII